MKIYSMKLDANPDSCLRKMVLVLLGGSYMLVKAGYELIEKSLLLVRIVNTRNTHCIVYIGNSVIFWNAHYRL